MLLNARPSKPSLSVSEVNSLDTFLAASTAWALTVRPPTVTTSVYTSPLEELPSPYEIFQVALDSFVAVVLLVGLYSDWPLTSLLGVSEEKTHRSDDPVSKSRLRTCAGVPMETGVRYSD